jgi:hypothetical protein
MKKKLKNEINLTGLKDPDSQYASYMSKIDKKKTVQQKLGIEDDGMEPLGGKGMKMMDILHLLGLDSMYDKEE